jgi:hypothetical protein
MMVLSKQASSPRALAQRPAEAGCRATARRVQGGKRGGGAGGRVECVWGWDGDGEGRSRLPGSGPRGADDGGVEAGELPARPRPAPDEKPSKSVVDAAAIERPA